MWLLTKELALAVVKCNMVHEEGNYICEHCGDGQDRGECLPTGFENDFEHKPECIVTRAKLLLSVEYGVQSQP